MRFAPLFILLSIAACSAGTITDTFNQTQNNCNYSSNAPYGNCDVIGDPMHYDVQKASITTEANGFTSVTIYTNLAGVTNSNGTLRLGSFNDAGISLIPGDIFFYAPANNTAVSNFVNPSVTDFSNPQVNVEPFLTYGVALHGHNGLKAGDLYQITNPTTTIQTASQALNNPDAYIRRNLPVLFTSGVDTAFGSGVTVTANGNGTTAAEYAINVSFSAPATGDFRSWIDSGQVGMLYSSTDCGNDYILGIVNTGSAVPEPSSFALMFGGAVLVAGSAFSRRARKLLGR